MSVDLSSNLISQLDEAKAALLSRLGTFPKILIVLGSGLSELLKDMRLEAEIPYADIPHIKSVTVEGHRGRLMVGTFGGVRVACMQGRLHYYEGHSMNDVVFPFRAFAWAGADVFLLTNASGGLHPEMAPLDLLLIRDHLNLMGTNPLIGKNYNELGARFPDMTQLYNPELTEIFRVSAKRLRIPLREGVYAGIHGPSYETPAEIRMYRTLGADVVGMSTVPEAIAIHHMGRRVVGVSCITNLAAGVSPQLLVHSEVLENAKKAYSTFSRLIIESITQIDQTVLGRNQP